jgi:hypothetical protein
MSPVKLLGPIALLLAIAVLGGCGDSSTSTDDGAEGPTPAPSGGQMPTVELDSRPQGQKTEAGAKDPPLASKGKNSAPPLPRGVPLDASSPRVQKALADLLKPQKSGDRGSGDDDRSGLQDGVRKILEQLTKPGGEAASPAAEPGAGSEGAGLDQILEQLK